VNDNELAPSMCGVQCAATTDTSEVFHVIFLDLRRGSSIVLSASHLFMRRTQESDIEREKARERENAREREWERIWKYTGVSTFNKTPELVFCLLL